MPVKTVTRTYETFSGPTRQSLQRDVTNDDIYATESANRRQDQRIKDDLTNKLYRIELERIKPGLDVQLQTANFRTSVARPRTRHYSPEPTLQYVPRVHTTVDRRRYSTAGNLDIYRPKTPQQQQQQQQISYTFERPEQQKIEYVVRPSSAVVPSWRAHIHDSGRTNDLLNDYELRKQAEIRVRGRSLNGPRLYASEVSYLPYVARPRQSSTPPDIYRSTVDQRPVVRPSHPRVSSSGRKLSDGQYELDQFEKLMKRNFGSGGVNRNKTLLYTSPPYASSYEYLPSTTYTYPTLPRAGSAYYTGNTYYTGRPYYSDYYNYPYYSQPYYVSSYAPYHYEQKATDYTYPLYSPPTRVTAPWDYGGYYNSDYFTRSWLPPRYSYSYAR